MFDYQRDIKRLAIQKKKFAIFADCGLGTTLMLLEFSRHVMETTGKRVLIVAPLMVVEQTVEEARRFYSSALPVVQVRAAGLQEWLNATGPEIGVTNYEAIREGLTAGNLAGLVLDESSMLKNHYGEWGLRLIDMGRGLQWKLCASGTPAPNDRIEYANHAVFLDRAKTTNEFLAT
ncbi:MAG: SNF2-related protein, partial [Planctomyces sp.]